MWGASRKDTAPGCRVKIPDLLLPHAERQLDAVCPKFYGQFHPCSNKELLSTLAVLICGSARGAMNFSLHQQVGCMHELSGHGAPAPSLFCPNLRYTLKDRVLYVLVIVCLAAEIILNRESQCWKAFFSYTAKGALQDPLVS